MRLTSRYYFIIAWIVFIFVALHLYFFQADFFENLLFRSSQFSIYYGYAIFLLLGCIRGFTLIPSTFLIVIGLLFFNPVPLFILTITGIIVSSIFVYYFFEFLHLDKFFEQKHEKRIKQIRSALQKNELPIIIIWSAMPFLPTDVICYICGTLRVNFAKFILGIFIGEGAVSAIYIFLGHYLLSYNYIASFLFKN